MSEKRLQVMKEILPRLAVVGVLHNSSDPTFAAWGEQTMVDAGKQGLRPAQVLILSPSREQLERQIQALRNAGGTGLIVIRDFPTVTMMDDICRIAMDAGIAVIGQQSESCRAGALLS